MDTLYMYVNVFLWFYDMYIWYVCGIICYLLFCLNLSSACSSFADVLIYFLHTVA